MPQPPAASQPVPFSTPDPSRFRIPNAKHARRTSTGDGHPSLEGHSYAARPTPRSRFAPSWHRQQQHHYQTPSQTQTPVPAARKFRIASAQRTVNGGDDAIEDGSSPVGMPDRTPGSTPFAGRDEECVLVVRESPTATRTVNAAASVPSKRLRKQTRAGPEDDIEDVLASGGTDGEERAEDGEEFTVDDSGEVLMPDSVPEETAMKLMPTTMLATVATPIPQGSSSSLTRQRTSAARLLSSIQPVKRRRLFASPGLITSSPSESGIDSESQVGPENVVQEEGSEDEFQEEPEHEPMERSPEKHPPPAFTAMFQISRTRSGWNRDDDIVDNESSGDESSGDDEDIRDILRYGELLEYGESSDDDGHGRDPVSPNYHHADDMDEDMADEQDDAKYDIDMILDTTPPRVRQARLLRLQRQQQQEQGKPRTPMQRLPTFQRAKMFLSARKSMGEASEGDVDREGEVDGMDHFNDHDNDSQDAFTTPARRRYYDALPHVQPPPDLFSPQKKRRRQKRKSRGNLAKEGDELVSPSAAAAAAATAAINAPEQYVPGGLAANLRDWLVQVKSGGSIGGLGTAAGHSGKFVIDETSNGLGMCLALGQRQEKTMDVGNAGESGAGPSVHLLLAGEGGQYSTGYHNDGDGSTRRSIVSIAHPAWEIIMDGQPWIVASDWSMDDEKQKT
ncbi:hypothetical protein SBRCBS47491_008363 [Sporothrix bragantina]|uniref:Uncharacterized protein n=1 Tax=Sporothrix bragantina TaxID=671064 RepID=A0ABP0CKS9_9PEZI